MVIGDKNGINTWSTLLASALYHNDVVTKVGFDKRREDRFIHGRWLEGKCRVLEWPLHKVLDTLIDHQRKESAPPWIREPSNPSYHQL